MTPPPSLLLLGAGEWSSLITLLVLAVFSGISSYLQRRSAKKEEEKANSLPPELLSRPSGPASEPTEDWEGELRRLLGQPPPQAPSRPRIPPVPRRRPVPEVAAEEGPDLKLPPLVSSKAVMVRAGEDAVPSAPAMY